MNILFIIPRLYGGGAERVLTMLASELSKNNRVYIASHESRIDYELSDNVDVISLNISNEKTSALRKLVRVVVASLRLRNIKNKKRIDVSVSFGEVSNLENTISGGKDKTFISIRSNYSSRQFKAMKDMMVRFANRRANCIVVPSKGVGYDITHNYGVNERKVCVINNPCNFDIIEQKSRESISDEFAGIRAQSDFLFISVGRLIPEKGQWHIIKAFSEICRKNSRIHLAIIGDGELYERLSRLIIMLGVQSNVHLMGAQLNVFPYYKNADAFVFGSTAESFANVLLEAMACGVPVISSDYDYGAREILAPDTPFEQRTDYYEKVQYGILVRQMEKDLQCMGLELTDAEKALYDAMTLMINDKNLREFYAEKSLERIKDFDIGIISKEWNRLLNGM